MSLTKKILKLSNELRVKGFDKQAEEIEHNLILLRASKNRIDVAQKKSTSQNKFANLTQYIQKVADVDQGAVTEIMPRFPPVPPPANPSGGASSWLSDFFGRKTPGIEQQISQHLGTDKETADFIKGRLEQAQKSSVPAERAAAEQLIKKLEASKGGARGTFLSNLSEGERRWLKGTKDVGRQATRTSIFEKGSSLLGKAKTGGKIGLYLAATIETISLLWNTSEGGVEELKEEMNKLEESEYDEIKRNVAAGIRKWEDVKKKLDVAKSSTFTRPETRPTNLLKEIASIKASFVAAREGLGASKMVVFTDDKGLDDSLEESIELLTDDERKIAALNEQYCSFLKGKLEAKGVKGLTDPSSWTPEQIGEYESKYDQLYAQEGSGLEPSAGSPSPDAKGLQEYLKSKSSHSKLGTIRPVWKKRYDSLVKKDPAQWNENDKKDATSLKSVLK